MSRTLSIFIVMIIWPVLAQTQTALTPDSILRQISETGARPTLTKIYNDHKDWDKLLRNIVMGEDQWLQVAVALRVASDAGASEQLTLAVGEALEYRPSSVLKIAVPVFAVDEICGGPDIDKSKYDSYSLAINAIEARKKILRTISDPTLVDARDQCVSSLENAKSGIAKFYSITR